MSLHERCYFVAMKADPLVPKSTVVDTQCDAAKNECQLNLLAKNTHSNGQPLKSQVFCRIYWALNSGFRGFVFCDTMQSGRSVPPFWRNILLDLQNVP